MNETPAPGILVVEDNPQDLEFTLRALRRGGIPGDVHVARDGVEATEFLFGHSPPLSRLRLILLDLKVPRCDGFEVISRMKGDERTRPIPVVALTSSREPRDIARAYALGVNSYLVKPVAYDEYAAVVREAAHYWLGLNLPPNPE